MKHAKQIKKSETIFLSRMELANRWGVSIETCKRKERAGILTALKIGRAVRYRLTQVEAIESEAEVRR